MFSGSVIGGGGFVRDLVFDYAKSGGLWIFHHRYIFVGIVVGYFVFMYLYKLLRDFILKKL